MFEEILVAEHIVKHEGRPTIVREYERVSNARSPLRCFCFESDEELEGDNINQLQTQDGLKISLIKTLRRRERLPSDELGPMVAEFNPHVRIHELETFTEDGVPIFSAKPGMWLWLRQDTEVEVGGNRRRYPAGIYI